MSPVLIFDYYEDMYTYSNDYEEQQAEIVKALTETMAYKHDRDPFNTYYTRKEEFEDFLSGPMGLPSCGCGNPEKTLTLFLDALEACSLSNSDPAREALMVEKFGTKHVTENPLVQLVFYVLDDKKYIEHNFSIGGSYLTGPGKLLKVLLKRYLGLDEPTTEQISNGDFEIDVAAVLAS